jgi:hypothetical protein
VFRRSIDTKRRNSRAARRSAAGSSVAVRLARSRCEKQLSLRAPVIAAAGSAVDEYGDQPLDGGSSPVIGVGRDACGIVPRVYVAPTDAMRRRP